MVALDVCLLINRAASTLAVASPANSDICARVGSHTRLLCKLLARMSMSAYLASCRSGCLGFCRCVGGHLRLCCKLLVRMYWASRCGQPPAASLQAVGPVVLVLTGVCEQPPAASLQVVGPLVLGFTGAFGQPPAAFLQAVGPHVSELPCKLRCTRVCCCCACYPVVLLCVRRQG